MPPSNTNTVIAVMQKDIEYIKESIDEIKQSIKDSYSVFATKEEHLQNVKQIEEIKGTHSRLIWAFLGTGGSFLIGFFIFILKKLGVM